jgi:hypothetical protein
MSRMVSVRYKRPPRWGWHAFTKYIGYQTFGPPGLPARENAAHSIEIMKSFNPKNHGSDIFCPANIHAGKSYLIHQPERDFLAYAVALNFQPHPPARL